MRADQHLILHGLAVKRHSTPEDVAELVGVNSEDVLTCFESNITTGRVMNLGEKYALSPGTRLILDGEYSRHYAEARKDQGFLAAFERFERVNDDLKALITEWQVRTLPSGETITNDHSDNNYDEKIIDRLSELHERFMPLLGQMSAVVGRLHIYGERLEAALDKVEQGDHRWVSEVEIPSYHTVWFDLHEDLLSILGRTRVE